MPKSALPTVNAVAGMLSAMGWVLRSGGADGADAAFESMHHGEKDIFLPRKGFNGHKSQLCSPPHAAFVIARQHHPAWEKLSAGACRLHARNVQQVLGKNLDDLAQMIVCWTPGGKGGGGTGQALRIADAYDIPVFDLFNEDAASDALALAMVKV